jgi:hypothetical protein
MSRWANVPASSSDYPRSWGRRRSDRVAPLCRVIRTAGVPQPPPAAELPENQWQSPAGPDVPQRLRTKLTLTPVPSQNRSNGRFRCTLLRAIRSFFGLLP